MKMNKIIRCLILLTIVVGVSTMAFGADPNWIGAVDTDWHTAGNWDNGLVPTEGSNVVIGDPNYSDNYTGPIIVDIDAPADANELYIGAGDDANEDSTLNINSGGSLTTAGTLRIADDTVGIVHVLSGSPVSIGGDIVIGDDGVGTFSALASSTINVSDDLEVGDQGSGIFNMTGGRLAVSDNIHISKDDNGTGDMTLDSVWVTCDDLYVASNSDDGAGTGVGTLTLIDPNITVDNGDFVVGAFGTGTVTATGGFIDVDDDVEIGGNTSGDQPSGGTGTLTLTNTNITKFGGVGEDVDHFNVGIANGSSGEVIMNGTSTIKAQDNVCIGGDDGSNSEADLTSTGVGIVIMNDNAYLVAGDQMRIGGAVNSTGTLYMNDPNTLLKTVENEDLGVGKRGTGIIEMEHGTIIVDDDFQIGDSSTGTGTVTMNNASRIEVEGDIDVGGSGTGTLTMNDDAYMSGDDNIVVGDGNGGYLYMSPNTEILITGGGGGDFVVGEDGYGLLDMTGGLITVADDLAVAQDDSGDGDVIMNGGTINVDDDIDFASYSDISGNDPVANLTMSNGALITTGLVSTNIGGDFDFAKLGSGELRMMSGAKIDVGDSHAISIGEDPNSYAYVEIDDSSTLLICENLEIGRDGGSVDFDIERARIEIDDDFFVANEISDAHKRFVGVVNVVMDNNTYIDIGNKFKIGGNNARVTIKLLDGDINMNDGDDELQMPDSDSEDGYAVLQLGKDANDISIGQAKLELDGPLDYHNAGANDYIDFLGGGLLETIVDPNDGVPGKVVTSGRLTEQGIKDNIISGYFRTTYTQGNVNDETPGAGECIRPVYSLVNGGATWHVYLGVASTCVDPSPADRDDDCDVDLADLRLLAKDWLDTTNLEDFAELAADWEKCGMAYGYSCP